MRISDWSSDVCSSDLLQGQFVSAAEAEGWRSDNAMCFAADTMENLQQHYDRGTSSESRAKYGVDMGKFANWVPTGAFFIRADHWKNSAGIASLDKRGCLRRHPLSRDRKRDV